MKDADFNGTFAGRFVDDDDLLRSGRAWMEIEDGSGELSIPLSAEAKAAVSQVMQAKDAVDKGAAAAAASQKAASDSAQRAADHAQAASASAASAAQSVTQAQGVAKTIDGKLGEAAKSASQAADSARQAASYKLPAMSDTPAGGQLVRYSSVSTVRTAPPQSDDDAATRKYVDTAIAAVKAAEKPQGQGQGQGWTPVGIDLLPVDSDHRPVWAGGGTFVNGSTPGGDDGYYTYTKSTTLKPIRIRVSTLLDYEFSMWVKASQPTTLSLNCFNDHRQPCVASGTLGPAYNPRYLVKDLPLLTEWMFVTGRIRFAQGTRQFQLGGWTLGDSSGNVTVTVGGVELIPIGVSSDQQVSLDSDAMTNGRGYVQVLRRDNAVTISAEITDYDPGVPTVINLPDWAEPDPATMVSYGGGGTFRPPASIVQPPDVYNGEHVPSIQPWFAELKWSGQNLQLTIPQREATSSGPTGHWADGGAMGDSTPDPMICVGPFTYPAKFKP